MTFPYDETYWTHDELDERDASEWQVGDAVDAIRRIVDDRLSPPQQEAVALPRPTATEG